LRVIHVVEFPKSGGSWVRNMLQTYLGGRPYLNNRLITPRTVVQVHRLYHWSLRKAILVVRDPRDIYVSMYYFETQYEHRVRDPKINQFVSEMPGRPVFDAFADYLEAKLLHVTQPRFYYSEFLDSWLNRPNTCVIRYEDCLECPEEQLIRMARFVGSSIDLDRVAHAVSVNSFEHYTKSKSGRSRKRGETDNTQFARKGIAGDWQNHFNKKACDLIEMFEGSSLRRLGYESDRSWIQRHLSNEASVC